MAKALLNLYLLAYNAVSAAGWAFVLYLAATTVWASYEQGKDVEAIARATWNAVEWPLKIVQTMAAMEIIHAALGFVRSPLGSTLIQVSSRLWLVWAINELCPISRYQIGFPLMVLSWGLVEVPRYSFYALNLYNLVPSFLFFLRYHLFMVLYPSGVAGEVLCLISALPYLQTGVYAIQMPNAHNVAISLYTVVLMSIVTYIPGLPVMYGHMLTQRNRAYSKTKAKTA
ncbi:hypothetical protein Poli38472_001667 [Pythium oligandrum]|uniref:very-long-chain (3R)-3-hydroxyacyl-CoA dehydratase n=1 Tax=Pythium oligandrum TaxID=41045 RepID=A0A8K1FNL1_PYTOL|nr:hypothetical protein Poli38472_001667 [Pythium oligandrum]|eukprot:TMW69511.1 hypothetical protein Poli38472_001667 [Pythium oligandrum]